MDKDGEIINSRFLNFYFFVMYLYTSMPGLKVNMMANSSSLFLILGYGLTFFAALKARINFVNRRLICIFFIVIVWSFSQYLFHPTYFKLSPFIILEITAAYVIIMIYRESIYTRFEDTTYFLCKVALIGWILNITLHPFLAFLAENFGIEGDGDRSRTFLLYTVNMTETLRNAGFSWEPGKTACMTCIGILFYLLRTKCNLKSSRFWIMTACIGSTLSTTGFTVYMVIVFLCYASYNRLSIVQFSILGILCISISCLPFMGNKITGLMEEANDSGMARITRALTWDRENKYESERDYYVPQRFEGLMFSAMNVKNTNYLIGDGRNFQNFYINRVMHFKIKTSEGVLEIIVRYGIIIGICCYYLLYCSSVEISKYYDTRNKWIYFIAFILINISYNFWEVPIFMAIWMMPIYKDTVRVLS